MYCAELKAAAARRNFGEWTIPTSNAKADPKL